MPFILTIRERGNAWAGRGPVSSEHATRRDAEASLVEYVRQNWTAEMGEEPPADEGKMIGRYFEHVLEAYEISGDATPGPVSKPPCKQWHRGVVKIPERI